MNKEHLTSDDLIDYNDLVADTMFKLGKIYGEAATIEQRKRIELRWNRFVNKLDKEFVVQPSKSE